MVELNIRRQSLALIKLGLEAAKMNSMPNLSQAIREIDSLSFGTSPK
jgi:hypothetical protein